MLRLSLLLGCGAVFGWALLWRLPECMDVALATSAQDAALALLSGVGALQSWNETKQEGLLNILFPSNEDGVKKFLPLEGRPAWPDPTSPTKTKWQLKRA